MKTAVLPIVGRAKVYRKKIAIVSDGIEFTYQDIVDASENVAYFLLRHKDYTQKTPVIFINKRTFSYVAILFGIWRAGGIAVPLAVNLPLPELEYFIDHLDPTIIIADQEFEAIATQAARKRGVKVVESREALEDNNRKMQNKNPNLPNIQLDEEAMILYTSGTSGKKPKGVLLTHKNIQARVECLESAMPGNNVDHILHVLPLYHAYGVIGVLAWSLLIGAKCELLSKFTADSVWSHIIHGQSNIFFGVPTMYVKLIDSWTAASSEMKDAMSHGCLRYRLMVSGSSGMRVNTLKMWKNISTHTILERYGGNEIGVVLSNSVHGTRIPGSIGMPLTNMQVSLRDEFGNEVTEGKAGEICVKGPVLFAGYWKEPEATQKAIIDAWFHTGDIAVKKNGFFKFLGRSNLDIINTGGYTISALEVEEVLLSHPFINQCAVLGVEDATWGQRVCAAVVLKEGHDSITIDSLRQWSKRRISTYKIPTQLLILNELPHTELNKIAKSAIKKFLESTSATMIKTSIIPN